MGMSPEQEHLVVQLQRQTLEKVGHLREDVAAVKAHCKATHKALDGRMDNHGERLAACEQADGNVRMVLVEERAARERSQAEVTAKEQFVRGGWWAIAKIGGALVGSGGIGYLLSELLSK